MRLHPVVLPGSNLDRLRRMQAEKRRRVTARPLVVTRTPAMSRALDRSLSFAERVAALEEASPGRHIHPGQRAHAHPGPRFHEHKP